jgi:uncharacterized protein (AIM24 family)
VSSGAAPPSGTESDPDRFVGYLATAGELIAGGRFGEAEAEVLRSLTGLPTDLRALNLLALVRIKLGRLDEARATYREISAAAPQDATARRNLGLVALKLDHIDEAIPELEAAARLAPGDQHAWSYLGYAYAKKGDTVPAAAAFRRAGQDALAAELEHAATMRRPASGPKLASLQSSGVSSAGTPPPASVPSLIMRAPSLVAPEPPPVPEPLAPAPVPPAPVAAVVASVGEPEPDAPAELVPVPLLAYVLSRLGVGVAPPAPAGEALRLSVTDDVYVREGVALAAAGVRFEPAFRRAQGRSHAEPLATDGAPFFRLVGPGDVWVAGRAGHWQALCLEDDILYVREDRVLAFDGGVSWEAGAVPGDGLRMLQFRGHGCVVLRLDAPPVAVKVTEDRPALVARAHLLGWVGRLVTHRARSSSPFQLACQGEGVMLFDRVGDPERVPAPPGHADGSRR